MRQWNIATTNWCAGSKAEIRAHWSFWFAAGIREFTDILQATGITNVIAALKHDVQRPDITAVEKDVIVFEYAGQLLGRDLCISVDRAVSQRQRLRGGVILEAAGCIVSAAYRALCDVENGAAEGNRAIRRPRTDAIGRPHCDRACFGGNDITAKFIIRKRG